MNEIDVKALAAEIVKQMPRIPAHMTYLKIEDIAQCLNLSVFSAKRIVKTPDFPPAHEFDNGIGGKLNRRWLASDFDKWAKSHRGRAVS